LSLKSPVNVRFFLPIGPPYACCASWATLFVSVHHLLSKIRS
jgi:hypothetical protein